MKYIEDKLFSLADPAYKDFQCSLMPTVERDTVIGVRTPQLRKLAGEFETSVVKAFLNELPHRYYEENNLHAFLIEREKDINVCYELTEDFLLHIDNWATCDSFFPKALKKDRERLLSSIDRWLAEGSTYTVRFAIGMLMRCFLDDDYKTEYSDRVADVDSSEYYVNMMCAWYFATALAKQYDSIIPYFEKGKVRLWVHNKAIQKACESYRVTKEHKDYLRSLKKKKTAE